ncbi:Vacuolar acid trehalase [Metarhizium anisopliae]|nr:Vacuolar acid trehalase [Metarhizium anisopliae]
MGTLLANSSSQNGVNNGAFTVASASKLLQLGNKILQAKSQPTNQTWNAQTNALKPPKTSSGIMLGYDGMNNGVVSKPADVVLVAHSLAYGGTTFNSANKLQDL